MSPRWRNFLLVALPLSVFAAVVLLPVRDWLYHDRVSDALVLLVGSLLVLVGIEAPIFRYLILPRMGEVLGEKLYGGTYVPTDDALVQLAEEIRHTKNREQMPALRDMVRGQRRRLRGWLELSRLYQDVFSQPENALEALLDGADNVSGKEDRALLLYRAAHLCADVLHKPDCAQELYARAAKKYPKTVYGRQAAAKI